MSKPVPPADAPQTVDLPADPHSVGSAPTPSPAAGESRPDTKGGTGTVAYRSSPGAGSSIPPPGTPAGGVAAFDPSGTGAYVSTGPDVLVGEDRPTPTIPGYEVLQELGRGGMGVVYKARQTALNRVVALKMIRDSALAGPQERARFRKEAEAVAELRHPGIVQIYELDECRGLPYFSMELMEGGNLAALLEKGPLASREATGLIEAIARAIHAAHEKGIVHRDLKPANVLLASGEACVTPGNAAS